MRCLLPKGVSNRPCQKVHLSFTLHFQRKVEHLRLQKRCKKQLKSIDLLIDLARGKGMFFVDFSGDVLFDFHGLQIMILQWKKNQGPDQQVLEY